MAGAYHVRGWPLLTALLALGMFGTSAMAGVLNVYTTELFPTHLRGDAFGWASNLIGRAATVLVPPILGAAAATYGWGSSVAATAAGPALALVLIVVALPETRGRELEETSAL